MMKKLANALLLTTALTLAGCANIANGINEVSAALTSPQTTAAIANLKAAGAAITCAAASIAGGVQAFDAALQPSIKGGAAVSLEKVDGYVNVAFVANKTLCGQLGGVVTATPPSVQAIPPATSAP
jgi:hypothetical protein